MDNLGPENSTGGVSFLANHITPLGLQLADEERGQEERREYQRRVRGCQ